MEKKTKRTFTAIAAVVGGAAIVMVGLSSLKKEPQKRPAKVIKRYVRAQKVEYRNIESTIVGSGRLASMQQVDLIAEVQGKILPGKVILKKGQNFNQGDLLVRIYDEEFRLGLLGKKSRFLNSVANLLPDLKIDYPDSFARWQSFFDAINLEKTLPQLPDIRSGKEKIFLASRNILSDYYAIKSDEIRLNKYRINAPFKGSFSDVHLEIGSIANLGSRLARMIRTDRLELEVPVETQNIRFIAPGQQVAVFDEEGMSKGTGKVVRKSDFIDPATHSVSVFVALSSSKENPLFEGQYLRARFPGIVVKDTMEIPRNAVFNGNEVFIVNSGKLIKKEIQIKKINQKTIFFTGLPKGSELVVEPLINVKEKSLVEIIR